MSLADQIKAVTGPVVKGLIDQLGSTVTFRRAVLTRGPDNASRRVWSDLGTAKVLIENLNVFKAQQLWGMNTTIAAQALLPRAYVESNDIVPISKDGMVVTAGFLEGSRYTIDQVKPDDLGQNFVLALVQPEDNDI